MPWLMPNLIEDENLGIRNILEDVVTIIKGGRKTEAELKQIISIEVSEWQISPELKWMNIGERYYQNDSDILKRQRKAVGESGAMEPVQNLANNKLVHAFARKLTDQKVGYLLSKPMNIRAKNKKYEELLTSNYFDKNFMRQIQSLGTESIKKGKAWLHPYYNDQGQLRFMLMSSQQCIPIWADSAHTELQAMIRYYPVQVYEGMQMKTVWKTEWWDTEGVRRFTNDGGELVPDVEAGEFTPHVVVEVDGEQRGYTWERVPFICFKYNDDEIPLIKFIKSLVDDYDKQKSDNANNLEDLPNSIYKVKNYGDTDGATFRKNIATYRVVFVGEDGDVDSISIPVETESVKQHLEINRKDIYEFGRGVDTQSDKFGNLSGVAIRQLYTDLDMDCNIIENQFQAALEQLMWFIDTDLASKGMGDYFDENVEFVFNRDILINEDEVIENINKSQDLSLETRIAQHPYVDNVVDELERIKREREERLRDLGSYPLPNDPRILAGTDEEE